MTLFSDTSESSIEVAECNPQVVRATLLALEHGDEHLESLKASREQQQQYKVRMRCLQ